MRRMTIVAAALLALSLPLDGLGRSEEGAGPAPPAGAAERPFGERIEERNGLVERSLVGRGIEDGPVLEAMRRVPRHLFVPPSLSRSAYLDTALPIGFGQTISQPYVVACMTQALELARGDRVLEIGTGSGYQAAILAEIVEEVYSIEIVPELAAEVRLRLASLGYEGVRLRTADGYFGWQEAAPFDKMMVTAAVDHVPTPLLRQLAPGGVMILPLGPPGGVQTLLRIRKHPDGTLEREALLAVRFVPMTGRALE